MIRDILLYISNADHKVTIKELCENVCDSSYAVTRRTLKMMVAADLVVKHGYRNASSYTASDLSKSIYGRSK